MIDWEDKGNRWVAGDWVIRKGYSGRRGGKRRETYSLQRYGDIGNVGVFSTLAEAKAAGEKRAGGSASKEGVVRKAPKTKSTEPESGKGKSESVLGPITADMTSDQRFAHDRIRAAASRREVEFQQRQASSPEYQESYARMTSRSKLREGKLS